MKIKRFMLPIIISIVLLLGACSSNSSGTNTESGNSETKSSGEKFTFIYADVASPDSITNQEITALNDRLQERTDGRLTIDIFPAGQLGGEREIIENLQTGDVTLSINSVSVAVNFLPELQVFDIPYHFKSVEHGRHVFRNDGPLYNLLKEKYEEKGFKLFGYLDQRFRTLGTNKEVKTADDVQGLRVRAQENPNQLNTWKLLGANPTPMAFNELYTALEQGTVDAYENSYELITTMKLYEPISNIVNTNVGFQTIQLVGNLDFYNKLPDDLRTIFDEEANKTVENVLNRYSQEQEEEFVKVLTDNDVTVTSLPQEEIEKLRTKTLPVIDEIRKQVGDDLVDTYLEEVESFK